RSAAPVAVGPTAESAVAEAVRTAGARLDHLGRRRAGLPDLVADGEAAQPTDGEQPDRGAGQRTPTAQPGRKPPGRSGRRDGWAGCRGERRGRSGGLPPGPAVRPVVLGHGCSSLLIGRPTVTEQAERSTDERCEFP